jgi:hypothetical protein
MPLRTYVILLACAVTVAIGSIAMSWSFGPHHQLEQTLQTMLQDDTEGSVRRNFSPFCAVGSCPKVSMTSTLPVDASQAESIVRLALARQSFDTEYDDGWYRSTRPGTSIRYRILRDGSLARIEWEAAPRF